MKRKIRLKDAVNPEEVAVVIRRAWRTGDDALLVSAVFKGLPLQSLRKELGPELFLKT